MLPALDGGSWLITERRRKRGRGWKKEGRTGGDEMGMGERWEVLFLLFFSSILVYVCMYGVFFVTADNMD